MEWKKKTSHGSLGLPFTAIRTFCGKADFFGNVSLLVFSVKNAPFTAVKNSQNGLFFRMSNLSFTDVK
jgi:hypothetical protein